MSATLSGRAVVAISPFPTWDQLLHRAGDLFPAIAWSLVIVGVTYIVSRLASDRLRGTLERGGFKINVAILLARSAWLGLWVVGLLLVASEFGVGLTPLGAAIGVVGLAASLSLQQVLQNLVAGVYLLAERPFAIGDYIAVVGPAGVNHDGRVEDIQMRTTHLRNRDNELILVPNSAIFGGVVTNRTAVGGFVQHVNVTFPRDVDLELTRQRLMPILQQLPSVLSHPQPHLRVDTVTGDSWTACLSIWARGFEAESDAVWAICQSFPDASVNDGGSA